MLYSFRWRLLSLGCLLGGSGQRWLLGSLRDQLRIGIRRWSVVLDNKGSSDDVVSTRACVPLLGRRLGPLCFRDDRVACGDVFDLARAPVLQQPPLPLSNSRSPCSWPGGHPRSHSTEAILERPAIQRSALIRHRWYTGVRISSYSAFGTWWHTATHGRGSEGERCEWSG